MDTCLKRVILVGFIILCILPSFAQRPVKKVERLHCFSNPNALDTFRLSYHSLERDDILVFDIISSEGKLIFHEKFPVWALYDDFNPFYNYYYKKDWKKEKHFKNYRDSLQVTDSLKRAEKKYTLARLNQIFDEKYFHSNPLPDLFRKAPELLIKGSYEEFLEDTTTIGFILSLADEHIRGLAYSKKKKKVVAYYACC